MQHNKMCFITCLNDEILYDESVRYINSLHVPDDFEVEIIAIRDAKSLTEGYNRAMRMSDAKYKVYLHQDTLIINKSFINDVVSMFTKYPKLGMMGVIGAEKLSPRGTWWTSPERYGKVYESSREGGMMILETREISGDYQPVEAVDGLILMTQYDLNWRDDLFKGWHMYDISQCMEFIKEGYEIGIPKQESCWCAHDCGPLNLDGYEDQRTIFIQEYSHVLNFPLVSILIPTYNRPVYLQQALDSALSQSYKNIEIIICDDSTNLLSYKMIQPYLKKYNNINYVKNETRQNIKNPQKCLELSNGEYINFLMDDDLFRFDKIEKMIDYFLRFPNIKLVTSYRKLIDQNNNELPDEIFNRPLFQEDTFISGINLGDAALKHFNNIIGEPTTVMFRKSDIKNFGTFQNLNFSVVNDLATWLSVLCKGDAIYISEPLSFFRQHLGQNQRNLEILSESFPDWYNLIVASSNAGFMKNSKDYKMALHNYIKLMMDIIRIFNREGCSYKLVEKQSEFYINSVINRLITLPDN